MNTIPRPPIHRVFIWQALATLLISGIFFPLNRVSSYSFFLGCLVQILGNLYFARLAFRYTGARQAKQAVQSMYRGEAGKMTLTLALFAVVFATARRIDAVSVFAGYLVMFVLYIVLTARTLKQRTTFTNRP